jgi:hypothetical protein
MPKLKRKPAMDRVIKDIAHGILGFDLQTNNSDDKDFHDVAVWQVKEALERAYRAGKDSLKTKEDDK